jgi:hypothetical protein
MVQKLESSTSQSFDGIFGLALKGWLFVFITVLVPLDFLYRSGILLNNLPPLQLVRCFSSTVIFFTIFAVIISLLSVIAGQIFTKITLNGIKIVNKANAIPIFLFVSIIFSDYLWPWIEIISSNNILTSIKKYRYVIIIMFFIALTGIIFVINRRSNYIILQVEHIAKKLFKLNVAIIIISSILLLSYAIVPYFLNYKANFSLAMTDNNKSKSYPNIILITFDAHCITFISVWISQNNAKFG